MNNENLLLLFTAQLPCWDEETVILAGENPTSLRELVQSGDLMKLGSGYVLTPEGVKTREKISNELFIPVTPHGEIIIDTSRARSMLELNLMHQRIPQQLSLLTGE